ncbi:hypothetical protein [Acinetobacter baumannii]|uniref:hypothetical protein n=1 Tax=Acinetobacter baumannii TaxID=470 RepID=UPI000BF2666A|nr:hypothetical protein [Acinetobacter baumannii]
MNISIQATVSLTQAEIKEAIAQYVANNGLDLEGKEVDYSTDLPESVMLVIDGTDAPQIVEPKAKSKAKVQAKPEAKVEVKNEAPKEEPQPVPEYKKGPSEEEKAAASAEVKAAIEQTQKLLESAPDPKKTPVANPFAQLGNAGADTDELEPDNDDSDIDDQPFGQDVLDEEDTTQVKPTKAENLFAAEPKIDAEPKPRRAAATKLFG